MASAEEQAGLGLRAGLQTASKVLRLAAPGARPGRRHVPVAWPEIVSNPGGIPSRVRSIEGASMPAPQRPGMAPPPVSTPDARLAVAPEWGQQQTERVAGGAVDAGYGEDGDLRGSVTQGATRTRVPRRSGSSGGEQGVTHLPVAGRGVMVDASPATRQRSTVGLAPDLVAERWRAVGPVGSPRGTARDQSGAHEEAEQQMLRRQRIDSHR